jgi:hypothetical protein
MCGPSPKWKTMVCGSACTRNVEIMIDGNARRTSPSAPMAVAVGIKNEGLRAGAKVRLWAQRKTSDKKEGGAV